MKWLTKSSYFNLALTAFSGNTFTLYLLENNHKSSPSRLGSPLMTLKESPPWSIFTPKIFTTWWPLCHDFYKYGCRVVKIIQYEPKKLMKDELSIAPKTNNQMQLLAWEITNFLIGSKGNMSGTGLLCSCLIFTYFPECPVLANDWSFSLVWKWCSTRSRHRAKPISTIQNPTK